MVCNPAGPISTFPGFNGTVFSGQTRDEEGVRTAASHAAMCSFGMRSATGKDIGGKVVVDDAPLKDGESVTVLARVAESRFALSPEDEAELLLSIAEADRGETIFAEEVLAKLARRRGGCDCRSGC